jgi:hypothetical protein
VVALASLLTSPRIRTGVPDDDDARAAWAMVAPGLRLAPLDLRFESEIGVSSRPGERVTAEQLHRAEVAETLLLRALRRHPTDPRLHTAIGHLDLVRQRPNHAASRYQAAIDLAAHHDEARLGLGVALARLAEVEPDPIRRRRLQLRAIAQLIAVRPGARARVPADFDRAMLLAEVGRMAEARRAAHDYLMRDPSQPWAGRLVERIP